MFRHSIATHLIEEGIDLINVREHLGHSSISVTSRYLKSFREKKDILKKFGPLSKGVENSDWSNIFYYNSNSVIFTYSSWI